MRLTTLCMMSGLRAIPPPSELLHLNQAGVQNLISYLTDTQPRAL